YSLSSFETENATGMILNSGSSQIAEHFRSRLLVTMPHSPNTANEGVLPVAMPCLKASRNASSCSLRPTNSRGFTGKLGSGIIFCSKWNKSYKWEFPFVPFVPFCRLGGPHDGLCANTSPIVRSGGELWMDLTAWVGGLRNSVWDFGNEGVVFDEGIIGERLRSADSEPDERQRNPVVQFLDNAGVAENDLVHNDVVSVFPVVRHGTPPRFVGLGFPEEKSGVVLLLSECLISVWQARHSSGSTSTCRERWSTVNAGRPSRRSSATSSDASSVSRL